MTAAVWVLVCVWIGGTVGYLVGALIDGGEGLTALAWSILATFGLIGVAAAFGAFG